MNEKLKEATKALKAAIKARDAHDKAHDKMIAANEKQRVRLTAAIDRARARMSKYQE